MRELHHGIHPITGKAIAYILGDTYPISRQLGWKGLGFRFNNKNKIWLTEADKINKKVLLRLQDLDVNLKTYNISDSIIKKEIPPKIDEDINIKLILDGDKAVLSGNTFPYKYHLGHNGLHFKWNRNDKRWEKPLKKITQEEIEKMKSMGFDLSSWKGQSGSSVEEEQEDQPIKELKKPLKVSTNKTDFDEYSRYDKIPSPRYLGFPPKLNIYETVINPSGIDDEIKVVVDRWYNKGVRGKPRYIFNLFLRDKKIGAFNQKVPDDKGVWQRGTPLFNEDSFVEQTLNKINNESFAINTKIRAIYNRLKKLEGRDENLKNFLQKWDDWKYDREKSDELRQMIEKYIPEKTININQGEFQGNFPIKAELMGNDTLHLITDIDSKLAPHPATLTSVYLDENTQNIKDLNSSIEKTIQKDHDRIVKSYIQYLRSFPYNKEDIESSKSNMSDLASFVGSNYNTRFFKEKLLELGLIRPSKKQRQEEGLARDEDIKYVINDKEIRNKIYARGAGNRPEFFYDVLAYYLMRKARNITSFTEMMLVTNINAWVRLAKQYDHDLNVSDVDKYLDKLSSMLLEEITGQNTFRSRFEQYRDFYSGFGGGRGEQEQGQNISQGSLEEFIQRAKQHGIDESVARKSPRKAFRALSMMYHPDRYQDETKKQEVKKVFDIFSQLWSKIPEQLKTASNWYYRSI